jgi:hypothetical protein
MIKGGGLWLTAFFRLSLGMRLRLRIVCRDMSTTSRFDVRTETQTRVTIRNPIPNSQSKSDSLKWTTRK